MIKGPLLNSKITRHMLEYSKSIHFKRTIKTLDMARSGKAGIEVEYHFSGRFQLSRLPDRFFEETFSTSQLDPTSPLDYAVALFEVARGAAKQRYCLETQPRKMSDYGGGDDGDNFEYASTSAAPFQPLAQVWAALTRFLSASQSSTTTKLKSPTTMSQMARPDCRKTLAAATTPRRKTRRETSFTAAMRKQ